MASVLSFLTLILLVAFSTAGTAWQVSLFGSWGFSSSSAAFSSVSPSVSSDNPTSSNSTPTSSATTTSSSSSSSSNSAAITSSNSTTTSSTGTTTSSADSTSSSSASCGDGTVNADRGEECDDGNTVSGDGCSATCQEEFCGDGTVQEDLGENCDDGNTVSGDGCSATCQEEFCGDGMVQEDLGEQCDPVGSGFCAPGISCTSHADCDLAIPGPGPHLCGAFSDDGDGCSATCQREYCGDGTVQVNNDLVEECDDGNTEAGDGCNDWCQREFCGDGTVQPNLPPHGYPDMPGEQCDDGSHCISGLGEPGSLPVMCTRGAAGDELCQEALEDENAYCTPISGDGCSVFCETEYCGDGMVNNTWEECEPPHTCTGDRDRHCGTDEFCEFANAGTCELDYSHGCNDECQAEHENCCICEYEEVPACAGFTTEYECSTPECADRMDNDGDGKRDAEDPDCLNADGRHYRWNSESGGLSVNADCQWDNNEGCVSRFYLRCKAWVRNQSRTDGACADWSDIVPESPNTPQFPDSCNTGTNTLHTVGHSSPAECPVWINRVTSCITCTSPNCEAFFATHIGCSTGSNVAEAEQLLAGYTPPSDMTVSLSMNQTTSTESCTTYVNLTLEEEEIEVTYDPCEPSDYCPTDGESARCTILGDDGFTEEVVSQTCCDNMWWQSDDTSAVTCCDWGGACSPNGAESTCHGNAEDGSVVFNSQQQSCVNGQWTTQD